MAERRSLTKNERLSLWLKSDGYCSLCGERIRLNDFHADHVIPYSKGGPTEALNMQATCKACNLKKGNKSMVDFTSSRFPNMRDWQKTCFAEAQAKGFLKPIDPLIDLPISVSPGGGKTIFALMMWESLQRLGLCKKMIVVVPSLDLFRQWQAQAKKHGYRLSDNLYDLSADSVDGAVLTYQAICSSPNTFHAVCKDCNFNPKQVFLICDEFHRVSEFRVTGEKLRLAFENVGRRLLMSGTFFRTDKKGMPWINYDEQGNPQVLYEYTMPTAIINGVLRDPEFLHLDGTALFSDVDEDGEVYEEKVQFSESEIKDESKLINDLVNNRETLNTYLQLAINKLADCRKVNPDDKGGIVVSSVSHAHLVQTALASFGVRSTVIVTPGEQDLDDRTIDLGDKRNDRLAKDQDNARLMDEFRAGRGGDFIISVAMLREGTDLPDWRVMVYLSRCRALLSFYQFIARCMRIRCNCKRGEHSGLCDHATGANKAFILMPNLPTFIQRARDVFNAIKLAKKEPRIWCPNSGEKTLFDQTRFLLNSQTDDIYGAITRDDALEINQVETALDFTHRLDKAHPAKAMGSKLRGIFTHAELLVVSTTVNFKDDTITTSVHSGDGQQSYDSGLATKSTESPSEERKRLNTKFNTDVNRIAHTVCTNRGYPQDSPQRNTSQPALRNKIIFNIHDRRMNIKEWDNKKVSIDTLKQRDQLTREYEIFVIRNRITDV